MYQLTAEEERNRLFSILTKLTFQWGKLSYLRRVVREVLCVETIFELVHESCGQRMFDEKNRDYEFRTQKCFGASPGPMGSRQKVGYFSMCDGKPVERNVMIFFSLRWCLQVNTFKHFRWLLMAKTLRQKKKSNLHPLHRGASSACFTKFCKHIMLESWPLLWSVLRLSKQLFHLQYFQIGKIKE